jgi:ribosome recycling factor
VTIRKIREEAQNEMKASNLPEDDMFRAKDELQKIVDESNSALESIFERKETEIMN